MTFVVTSNCKGCRYTDCVVVCPVDCFHGDEQMLYIDPDECIDCGACVPECPVDAIYEQGAVPLEEEEWLTINADRAKVLPVVKVKEEPLSTPEERAAAFGFKA